MMKHALKNLEAWDKQSSWMCVRSNMICVEGSLEAWELLRKGFQSSRRGLALSLAPGTRHPMGSSSCSSCPSSSLSLGKWARFFEHLRCSQAFDKTPKMKTCESRSLGVWTATWPPGPHFPHGFYWSVILAMLELVLRWTLANLIFQSSFGVANLIIYLFQSVDHIPQVASLSPKFQSVKWDELCLKWLDRC